MPFREAVIIVIQNLDKIFRLFLPGPQPETIATHTYRSRRCLNKNGGTDRQCRIDYVLRSVYIDFGRARQKGPMSLIETHVGGCIKDGDFGFGIPRGRRGRGPKSMKCSVNSTGIRDIDFYKLDIPCISCQEIGAGRRSNVKYSYPL